MPQLALKVDVDTYRGMKDGVPVVMRSLEGYGLTGSFFISFGPDRSGLAILQMVRPRFLAKMIRTNAPGMYGLKTALYGTLLKAPMIGRKFPELIQTLAEKGHEVACHAWDHRLWQDWLPVMREKTIVSWFDRMVAEYVNILGREPGAFGAPGWRMDTRALTAAASYGFSYLSCTRAKEPFVYAENNMLEMPSNLPCIEEVGVDGVMDALEKNSDSPVPQVLPVHAEVEGTVHEQAFGRILEKALSLGYTVKSLADVVSSMDRGSLPVREMRQGFIPGRAFRCSV